MFAVNPIPALSLIVEFLVVDLHFLSHRPRDDDFDSADERGMETLLEYYRERLASTEVGPKKFHHGPR